MRLLLDTNIIIRFLEEESDRLPRNLRDAIDEPQAIRYVSVASLWEIALKSRLGKLPLRKTLRQIPLSLDQLGVRVLLIDQNHALAELLDNPPTRDPFDRLLLAQCQVENLRLVTIDRALAEHPLAWREA